MTSPVCDYPIERVLPLERRGMEPCGAPAAWRCGAVGQVFCDHHKWVILRQPGINERDFEALPTAEGQFAMLAQAWRDDLAWQIEHCRDGGGGYPRPSSAAEALESLIHACNIYSGQGAADPLCEAIRRAEIWLRD